MSLPGVVIEVAVGERVRPRVAETWSAWEAQHLHFDQGFTLLAGTGLARTGLARAGDELVGLVSVRFGPAGVGDEREGFIDVLNVRAPWRRQGIGRRLVSRCAAECQARGVVYLRAWSSEDKTAALSLWRSLGFDLAKDTIVSARTGEPVSGYFVTLGVGRLA